MRGAIVGVAVACAVAVAMGVGSLVYGLIPATTQDDGQDWRQHRLAFLKAAYDRVQGDLARSAKGGAASSWRGEADTILQAMAEVANPMPADSVPSDIRLLLLASAPSEQDAPAASIEAVSMERSVTVADEPPSTVAAEPEPSTSQETPSEPSPPRGGFVESAVQATQGVSATSGASDAPRTLSELAAALHAEKTDRGLRVILPADSLFSSTRDALDPAADPPLSSLAELIVAMEPREIVVIGHTDPAGEDVANLKLSKKQAHAVVAWLGARVERQPHFVEHGYGRSRPVAPNKNADGTDNTEGRQQNRRIEILLRRN